MIGTFFVESLGLNEIYESYICDGMSKKQVNNIIYCKYNVIEYINIVLTILF